MGINVKVTLTIVNLFYKNFGLMALHSYLWRREGMQVILLNRIIIC